MTHNPNIRHLFTLPFRMVFLFLLVVSCSKSDNNNNNKPTATIPVLITANVSAITQSTAQCGGTISSDGGETINTRGVCWSVSQNPTISDLHTSDGTGAGTFTSQITGLNPATPYYVRAYATNSVGTGYGSTMSFSTTGNGQAPTVTTSNVSSITNVSASSGGNVTSQGSSIVTARGICWSTSQNPSISDTHSSDGTGTGAYVSLITGLNQNTPYYIRAYATNSVGTSYGSQVNFTTTGTGQAPTVSTTIITNITQTSASSGGDVTNQGSSTVTTRGICWSAAQNPTISDQHTSNGSGSGSFISQITGLVPNTPYFVRAYATNSIGTSYGSQMSFSTLGNIQLPTLTTSNISNITQTSAIGGGNVTSEGGASVILRGICWSSSPNPTTANNSTNNGGGTGSFVSNIDGLSPATPYYVRAYAVNSAGTAYGNQVTFTTLPGSTCGQPITYEGKTYNTVLIGSQCWFKENINVGILINGPQIQMNNGVKEKYCYENMESNCTIYGGLYLWDEMMQGSSTPGGQGICPSGWHIPTDEEYTQLTTFLGGLSVAGGKMKETGISHWKSPNTGATNESGFKALPGGMRAGDGTFLNLTYYFWLWTSSDYGTGGWLARYINYNEASIHVVAGGTNVGYSARCVEN